MLAMLGQDQLARTVFPVGELTKAEVRAEADRRGLRTAAKPDSQDVCFIHSDEGRAGFLGDRVPLHPGRLVDDRTGEELGTVTPWSWSPWASAGGWGTAATVGAASSPRWTSRPGG